MNDRATANLPARDFEATAAFYGRLGFRVEFMDEGWMILSRGPLELEFFPLDVDPAASAFSACLRVDDLDALHAGFREAGLPEDCVSMPRISAPAEEHGLRIFALVDLDGSLLRCIENRPRAADGSARPCEPSGGRREGEEEELVRACRKWDRAMTTNDAAAIGRFMTEDWTIVGPDGGVRDRDHFLGLVESGALTHHVMDSQDLHVRVHGEAALVIHRGVSAGTYHGETFHLVERVSSIFVRRGGEWRCLSTHLSPLGDQDPPGSPPPDEPSHGGSA